MRDLRSVVGMTEGAKKRAARRDAVTAESDYRCKAKAPAVRRHMLEVFSACLATDTSTAEILRRYDGTRCAYRLGERLSACHGCAACAPNRRLRGWSATTPICDGTGVLTKK